MQIQINTDNHIEHTERMETYFTELLETGLKRFEEKITRIEVHFGDENSDKFGNKDKRCLIEARMEHLQPVAVTHHDATIERAFGGALEKVKKVLKTTYEKMHDR